MSVIKRLFSLFLLILTLLLLQHVILCRIEDDIKFSSEAAKKSVMADIKEAGLKLKDGKILGLNDLIEQMKQSDASAFVDESQQQAQQQQARFATSRIGHQQTPGSMTKKDIEAIKDPSERQAAIAQNIQLFQ